MRFRFILVLFFLVCSWGHDAFSAPPKRGGKEPEEKGAEVRFRPFVDVVRTETPPEIDGRLDDPAWADAAVISALTQVEPDEGAAPTERTEVRLCYDSDHLYIGVRAYDSQPSKITATEMERDAELESDDHIIIVIDTFLNRRRGYLFRTNPLGSRGDGLIENNRRVKGDDWNGIWYAKSSVDSLGWVAEIAIPFKTVSFDRQKTAWGLNVQRFIRRKNETARWAGTGIARGVEEVALAGELRGLVDIRQGIGLDVIPSIRAVYLDPPPVEDEETREKEGWDGEPSLDLFYSITPSLTAALTFNTDFSETEVDEREINFTRFDLFIPEKRDFFLQDQDLFEFGGLERNGRPFFSRRIGIGEEGEKVDIVAGGKVTGRAGNLNLGALAVRMDASNSRDETTLSVFRPSINVLKESSVGMIVTHGNPVEEEDNSVLGFDFKYYDSEVFGEQVLRGDLWWQQSYRTDVHHKDMAYGGAVTFPNEPVEASVGFQAIQKNFSPALGFVNRRGIRQYDGEARYRWRFRPDGYLRFIDTGVSTQIVEGDDDNRIQTAEYSWSAVRMDNRDGDRLELGCRLLHEALDEDFEIVDDVVIPMDVYDNNRFFGKLTASEKRPVSGGVELDTGEFYDGDRTKVVASVQLRPSSLLLFSTTYELNNVNLNNGKFHTYLLRGRVRLQLSPDISWNTLVQWDNQDNLLGINSIFLWTIEPGKDVYLVLNQFFEDDEKTGDGFNTRATEVTGKLLWTFRF